MKLNPIQHRMMINRGLAYVAFKCQKAGHKWASAMSAMRCAFSDLTTPRLVKASGLERSECWSSFSIDDADMNFRMYGDETIIDGDKKQATSVINLEFGCSVINNH
ncbi:hypothetical protein [Hafnia alvei]|uniref:hypothetical protein n=1 Tax=Hafnia alvei TaxID=569 RepID=UPI00290104B1|nr:hypothetical protein [Hafnia alvei]